MNQAHAIIIERAKEFFQEDYYYSTDSQGNLNFEIDVDFIEDFDFETIPNKNVSVIKNYIHKKLTNSLEGEIFDVEQEISEYVYDYFKRTLVENEYEILEKNALFHISEIRNILVKNGILNVHFNFDNIIKEINVDIIISLESKKSKDSKFELSDFSDIQMWIENTEQLISAGTYTEMDFSIIKILKSQGYSFNHFKSEVTKALATSDHRFKSNFIKSLFEECYNTSSCCNALIFTTQSNLFNYLNGETIGAIRCDMLGGFVDFVYGGGSNLQLKLEKDIPLNTVDHDIFIDGKSECDYGYSLSSIYGEFITKK